MTVQIAGFKSHGSGCFQNMIKALPDGGTIGGTLFRDTFHTGNPEILLQAGQKPALFGQNQSVQIHINVSFYVEVFPKRKCIRV